MNLHAIAAGVVAQVNPSRSASIRISAGTSVPDAAGVRTPLYYTPGVFTASIAGNVLDVTAQSAGKLAIGQTITAAGVAPGTIIVGLGTGTGGIGTYLINIAQTVSSVGMAAALVIAAQVQALTFKDLQQIDGLNMNGEARAMYLFGNIQGVVRADNKGGDLITLLDDGTIWLNVHVLETWRGWCKIVGVRQNS